MEYDQKQWLAPPRTAFGGSTLPQGEGRRIESWLPSSVRGVELDSETRCAHWRTALDIVAIRMKCCGIYYACRDCHAALADHPAQVWPQSAWDEPAVLCGACKTELSIREYLECGNVCPTCSARFNPGCRNHYHDYFEMDAGC